MKAKKVHEKSGRGRPKSPQQTALVAALIERQDAQSRRTRMKIAEIIQTHLPVEEVDAAWERERERVRATIVKHYTDAATALAIGDAALRDGVAGVEAALKRVAYGCLTELAGLDRTGSTSKSAAPTVPPFTRSRSLAAARAQSARFTAALTDLKLRIVRRGR